jgi:glucose-6-phosphate dehydrogenase assembly protein OpcA
MSPDPAPTGSGLLATEPIPVDLARIEGVLTSLWKHQDVVPGSAQGVLTRACMSNLIIVCRGRDQAALAEADVDEIVSRHPSRVILLAFDVMDAAGARPGRLDVTVSAHCHLAGDRRQVCSEMVQITAGGDDVRKLPSAARSLVIGDLPTSLWWDTPAPPPLAGDVFNELMPMADQVIYSSLLWPDPVRGTLATADWMAHARPGDPALMDLAWRALRPWRQLISQALDPAVLPGAIEGLTAVDIEHGPHGLPQAWLLAGWVASALGWAPAERTVVKGREISWRFRARRGEVELCVRRADEGEPQVRRVKTSWTAEGRPAALTFAPAGPAHLGATPEGYDAEVKVLALPTSTRAGLVAAELQRLEPDRVFQSALLISRKLAANLSL